MTRLSVVSPIYNEEGNIYDLYLSITDALKEKVESYETVLVNDGSRDQSAALLNEITGMDRPSRLFILNTITGKLQLFGRESRTLQVN